jgi:hypothetical protein
MPHRLRDEDRFHPRIGQRGGGKGFVATFPDCPGRTAGATLIIAPKPAAGLMIRLAAGLPSCAPPTAVSLHALDIDEWINWLSARPVLDF